MQGAEECAFLVRDFALYHIEQHAAQRLADMPLWDSRREHVIALDVEHREAVAALQREREIWENRHIAARSAEHGEDLHGFLAEHKERLLQLWNRRFQRIVRDGLGDSLALRVGNNRRIFSSLSTNSFP